MQFSVRLVGEDEDRLERLCTRLGIGKYQLAKRLLQIGMARVEGGADPLNPASATRLEAQFEDLRSQLIDELRAGRARDFNLALDTAETRAWLRVLGEIIAPNSISIVKTRVQNGRANLLAELESIPPDAPASAAEND